MKSIMFNFSVRNSLVVVIAALASVTMVEVSAAPASATASTRNTVADEVGTIPAARQGLPQQNPRGAEGPIREDKTGHADPSIRDSNPMTMNGLWETRLGNQVTKPGM